VRGPRVRVRVGRTKSVQSSLEEGGRGLCKFKGCQPMGQNGEEGESRENGGVGKWGGGHPLMIVRKVNHKEKPIW